MDSLVLELNRHIAISKTTFGVLRSEKHTMFTCEDQYSKVKIPGETRIKSGIYELKYRTEGTMLKTYQDIYLDHPGMLWLQNVIDFVFVYIHHGNTKDHTEGCILVGMGIDLETMSITKSRTAYTLLYREVQAAFKQGRKVFISITDRDQPLI
jgi:hypothetical protein